MSKLEQLMGDLDAALDATLVTQAAKDAAAHRLAVALSVKAAADIEEGKARWADGEAYDAHNNAFKVLDAANEAFDQELSKQSDQTT